MAPIIRDRLVLAALTQARAVAFCYADKAANRVLPAQSVRPGVTPLMRRGEASQRRTTQLQFSSGQTSNVHLPALKFSPAKNADPLIIERIPTPERIAYAQNRESIIEIEVSDHMQRDSAHCTKVTQSERRMIV